MRVCVRESVRVCVCEKESVRVCMEGVGVGRYEALESM